MRIAEVKFGCWRAVFRPSIQGQIMSANTKQTSAHIASIASEVLQDKHSSDIAKSLAASALAQRGSGRQTGAEMESVASKALQSDKYSERTKELAASVLAQANKER